MALHRYFRPLAALACASALVASSIATAALARPDVDVGRALDEALAGSHRSAENRARDASRHPKETLGFFGLRTNMTVMEVWPGSGGWYTEVLAPILKAHGRYVAASWDPQVDRAFIQEGLKTYRAKLAGNPTVYGKVRVTALQYPGAMTPVAPNSVDLVVTFRNLHNWLAQDDAAPAMLKAMYAALKPGGVLGIVDHRADSNAPVDLRAKLGYVNEAYAVQLVKDAGFEFEGSSEINANPNDTRDYEQGVWTLPPTLRLGDKDREKYATIGESDRFTLKFRKPLAR